MFEFRRCGGRQEKGKASRCGSLPFFLDYFCYLDFTSLQSWL